MDLAISPLTSGQWPGLEDLFGEDAARLVDDRELQLLLGAEVGEQAALADPQVARQALERDRLEPFRGRKAGGMGQDRLPRALAAQQPAVGRDGTRRFGHANMLARPVVFS